MLVVVVFCVVSLLLEQSITVHGYRSSTSTCIRNTKSVGIKRSSLSLGAFSDDSYASSTFPQLQRGQIVFLSDMNLPGVLRQRTKDSTWIIEVFYQNKSIGFVEREESTISIDSQRENNLVPENSDVDSQRLEELKNIMRWVKNNLGVRALSPVAATPSARPRTLGLHRYGIAPRGIPVHPYYQRDSVNSDSGSNSYSTQNYRYQSPRLSSTDFLISSLPINSPEVYENDALVSALSTALYRRGKVVEAQRLLQNNRASKVNKALSTAAGSAYDPYAHRLELRDAEGQHRMGDLSNSLSRYKEVLDRNQEIAESNFLYGVNLHDMGRVFEAIPYYQRAIELNPRHGNAYRNLGVAYSSLGMRKGALNCFYKCLAFDTEKVSSLVNIAALLWQSNDINDKRNAFQYIYEAMELAPDDARPRELLKWFLSQSASDLLQDTSSADGASVKLGSWFEDDLKGTETQQELEEEEIWRRELQQRMAASQTSIDERDDRQANLDDSYYVNTARDRLANDVLPQDHIAEEKRLMVEEKDMIDWDSALQSAWEQQLQRREEQLDRSSSKWEDFMRKSTEDLAKVDEQKRMKAMLAQLFGMSTEDFVNDSNSNSVSVISATESESLADSTKTSDELVTQSKTSLIGQNNEESQLPVGIAAAAEEIMSSSADSAFADISSNEESLQSLLETTGRTPEQQQVSAAYKVLDNLGELINLRDSKNIGWSDDDPTVQNYAKSVTELNKAQKAVDVALAEQEENRKSAIGAVTARKTSLRSKLLEKMKSKKLLSPESVDKPALEPEELKEILLDAAALDKLNQQSEWLTEQQQLKKAQKQERDEIFGRIASSRVAEMPKFSEPIPNFESTETEHVDSSTEMSNDVKYNQVFESTDNVVNESVAQPKAIANIQPTEMTSIPVMVTKLMRKILIEDLNYSSKEVNSMTPIEAQYIIANNIRSKRLIPRTVFDSEGNEVRVT